MRKGIPLGETEGAIKELQELRSKKNLHLKKPGFTKFVET